MVCQGVVKCLSGVVRVLSVLPRSCPDVVRVLCQGVARGQCVLRSCQGVVRGLPGVVRGCQGLSGCCQSVVFTLYVTIRSSSALRIYNDTV